MSKISKKLRAEAVKFAGIRATFFAEAGMESGPGDSSFAPEVIDLVREAVGSASIHSYDDDDGISLNEHTARQYAEAQAMLLEGWSPS